MTQPPPDWMSTLAEADHDGHEWFSTFAPPPEPGRESAVLMLFAPGEAGTEVILTERSHTMRAHPGQVSFPGGRIDPQDDGPVAAALRETYEEVGVDPTSVEVVRTLPSVYLHPSQNAVTPVLAWWPSPGALHVASPIEVEQVVRVRVAELIDPMNRFTAVFGPYRGPAFEAGGLFVWGFTAALLNALFELSGLAQPWDVARERPLPDRVRSPWMQAIADLDPDGLDDGDGAAGTGASR
jgi:8-oxo-dGTP pyrophosphatase MutT (NUDIX family)